MELTLTHLKVFHHAASSKPIQVTLACSCPSGALNAAKENKELWLSLENEWFYPSPYGQAGHTFFLLLSSLMGQGCWLGGTRDVSHCQSSAGWSSSSEAPAERNFWYSHLSGPSAKERQPWAVGATEQGESVAGGQGFPKGVGNPASTPCSAWFISGLIREGVSNHLFINKTRSANWRDSEQSRFSLQLLHSLLYTEYFYGSRNVNYGHLHRKTRSTRLLSEPLHSKFSLVFLEAN